jgi:transposase
MMARPTKLDADVAKRITDLVRVGNYVETAAAAAGVHKVTLHRWLRRGREEESGPYHDLFEALEKAQGESESRDVALLAKAAAEDWQAAAWRLERRFPRKYGARVQMSVQEELSDFLNRLEGQLDAETYERVLAATAFAAGGTAALGPAEEKRSASAAGVDPADLAELREPETPAAPDPAP